MSSAPRIVCRAGPNLSSLESVPVNSSSVHISSDLFEGNVFVRLKDYRGPVGEDGKSNPDKEVWFEGEKDTWSIAFEGKFKGELEVDEIVSLSLFDFINLSRCRMELTGSVRGLAALWKYLGETY